MATETTLKSRLMHCAKTTEQWSTNGTKVGKKGELLLEIIDTNHFKVKVGDGVTGYSSLPYMGEKWGNIIKIYNLTNTSTGTTKIANGDTLEQAMQKIQANLNTLNNKVYVTYSDTTPNAPTASGSAGTSTKVSRGDHAHPKQQDSYIKNDANAAGGEDYRLVLIDNTTGTATFASLCGSASNLKYDGLKFTATLSGETTWGGLSTSDFAKLTSGKISLSVIPDSVLGQLEYIGTWDATTGKAVSDTRPLEGEVIRAYRKGDYYIVKTAGTKLPDTKTITELDGLQIGDWIVYNGTTWDKIDNTDYIKTVAGISPTNGDILISDIVDALNKKSLIATTLKNARTFSLSGDVTATGVSFDGSANVALSTTIATDAVTTTKIKDANVTTAKIAAGAVTTAKIADANVTADKLAKDSVTTNKIVDANVTTDKIADSAVTTAKINTGAVTEAKIGASAVTTTKIADSAVTDVKINTMNAKKLTQSTGEYLVLDGNFF